MFADGSLGYTPRLAGWRLCRFRKRKGMTIGALSALCGISELEIARVEAWASRNDEELILSLCFHLGASADFVLFGEIPRRIETFPRTQIR